MPCRSDYMEPNGKEKRLQETAQLLAYVITRCSEEGIAHGVSNVTRVVTAAKNPYCSQDYVPTLCALLRRLPNEVFARTVYNAHDPMSRKLATWWEEHEAADEARREKEAIAARQKLEKEARHEKTRAILARLSAEEQDLVERYYVDMM